MQLRRLVIAESSRFPELGRTFYEQGPGHTIAALAATFERLADDGVRTFLAAYGTRQARAPRH